MNATQTIDQRPPRRGGLVGPVMLIGLGIVFLLNNLGLLSWDVWPALLRLWPILLIGLGLDLLVGRRSVIGSLLVAIALLAVMLGAIWWASSGSLGPGSPGSQELNQPLGDARRAEIAIAMAVGKLTVGAQTEPGGLVEGTIVQGERDELRREFTVRGDTAVFRLRGEPRDGWAAPFGQRGEAITWDLRLNPQVPTRLEINTGAASATIDLSRLAVSDLDINVGVGATRLTLPEYGRLQAQLKAGVGETNVIIPAGVAARIQANTGIGNVRLEGTFERSGNVYTTPGYNSAADRVDLHVSGGIGSVTVTQAGGP